VTIVDAPAKLTRELRITGVRDDGYHLIDAEMVSLELCDRLTFEPGDVALTATGPFADGVPLDESNLVARALRMCGRFATVHIDKHIPHGGGLGGGSADAAAVLRWAGYDDLVAASGIGADVPFCMVGGRARVRGIGELVEPLPFLELAITLIVPPLTVSTPDVYRAWDELGGPTGESANDLEAAAITAVPALAEWRQRITDAVGHRPTLAGSGATWFVEGHHPRARALAGEATVVFTRTRPRERPAGRASR
jgi:4-diphosphocytidyl-2-C-methyl-D-erythritol kinase